MPGRAQILETTRKFWDASPCDGQADVESRRQFRYRKEPWLPGIIEDIARRHAHVLEVGCGQGLDGMHFCRHLPTDGSYIGIDYSDASVESANRGLAELPETLPVTPVFRRGNAEVLEFADGSIGCVYSMGVLHHTADTEKAVQEIRRILEPGGRAYIFIYNSWSPKVAIAKALRAMQAVVDRLIGGERTIYKLIYGRHFEGFFGTMLLECFGVPIMRCYGRSDIPRLFSGLTVTRLHPFGYNLPWLHRGGTGASRFGVFWFVEAEKPRE